jgi:hypothetical protein
LLFALRTALISLNVQGRPEQLIPLVLAAPVGCLVYRAPRKVCLIASAVATGIILTASPLPGLLSGAVFIIALAIHEGDLCWRHWLRVCVFVVIAIAVSALIINVFSPFSFLEWIRQLTTRQENTMDMMTYLLSPRSARGFTSYSPLWNIAAIALLSLTSLILSLKRHLLTLALVWLVFAMVIPKTNDQGYTVFFPALFLLIHEARQISLPAMPQQLNAWLQRSCAMLAISAGVFYAVGYTRILQRGIAYTLDGMTLPQARQKLELRLRQESRSGKATIGYPTYTNPSFVAFAEPGILSLIGTTTPSMQPTASEHPLETSAKNNGVQIEYYIFPQGTAQPGSMPASEIYLGRQRYKLIDNHRIIEKTGTSSALLSKVFWPYSQGYHYALYQRTRS